MDGNAKRAKFQRAQTVPVKSSGIVFEKPTIPKKTNQYFWIQEDDGGNWHRFSNTNTDLLEVAFLAGNCAVYMHIEEGNFRIDFSCMQMIQAPLSERKRKIEHEIMQDSVYDVTWNITSHAWSQIPWTSFGSNNNNNETQQTTFESVHQRIQTTPYQICKYKRVRRLHQNPDAKPITEPPHTPSQFPKVKKYDPVLHSGLDSSLYHLEFGTTIIEWKLETASKEFIPFDYQTSSMIENALETGKSLIHLKHNQFEHLQATVDLKKLTAVFISNHNNNHETQTFTDHVLSHVSKHDRTTPYKIQRFQSNLPFDWLHGQAENCQLYEVQKNSVEFGRIEKVMLAGWEKWTVQSIRRIQNVYLWNRYCNERDHVARNNGGNPDEKFLFHGTGHTQPQKVYNGQSGFDFRYSSESNYYGSGTYFSAVPKYSHSYSSREGATSDDESDDEDENVVRQFMVARVVCGDVFDYGEETAKNTKIPPAKKEAFSTFETVYYDSVSGTHDGTTMFVVYSHYKAYPMYLISYRCKSES